MANQLSEEKYRVGETELLVLKAGQGKPLLVLHGELGYPGWLKWQEALAAKRTLLLPMHPGFGRTEQPDWIMDMRDLAAFYARFLHEQKLAPLDVVGFSLGGWLAAEMAVANSTLWNRMVLVGAAGLRPPQGEIMDLFTITARTYLNHNVLDRNSAEFKSLFGGEMSPAQFEAWEDARTGTARVAWKPYMFTQSMPHLLEGISGLPTLIVWGREDAVVPLSAGELYNQKIAGSRLVVFDHCGHMPEVERPEPFIRELEKFLA